MSITEIEKSLNELHQELERLLPAIQLAEKAVESVEIAKSIPEKHRKLIDELKSVFIDPKELEKKDFVNIYSKIKHGIEELDETRKRISKLNADLQKLINSLDKVPYDIKNIVKRLFEIKKKIDSLQGNLSQIETILSPFIINTKDGLQKIEDKLVIQNNNIVKVKLSVLVAIIISGLSLISLILLYFLKL